VGTTSFSNSCAFSYSVHPHVCGDNGLILGELE